MKKEDLARLKDLVKQYRKNRTAFWNKVQKDRSSDQEIRSIEQQREELLAQMEPLQEILFKEIAASDNHNMKYAVKCFYRGVRVHSIAESLSYTEKYIHELIREAESMVTRGEQ